MSMLITPPVPLPLAVANGGTGSMTAAQARTALGLDTPAADNFTLATGWSALGSLTSTYRKAANGWVEIRVNVQGSGGAAALIATLPAGYRPSARTYFNGLASSLLGAVYVDPDGTINVAVGNTTDWFTLTGGFFV